MEIICWTLISLFSYKHSRQWWWPNILYCLLLPVFQISLNWLRTIPLPRWRRGTKKETNGKELEIEAEGNGEDEGNRTETLGFVKSWLHMMSLTHTQKKMQWETIKCWKCIHKGSNALRFLHSVFKISEVKRWIHL